MSSREPSHAEKLVEELAECRRKEREFENWRWKSGVMFYKSGVLTRTVTETSFLGFKTNDTKEQWEGIPRAVAKEFHSFLAQKRNENYRRAREIERELEGLT